MLLKQAYNHYYSACKISQIHFCGT